MSRYLFVAVMVTTVFQQTAAAQYNTQRGSVLGGLAGAAAGVAIGEHNDEPLAGALIGGAVGLMSGAALGNARDRQMAEARAYQYQQQQQQQMAISRSVTPQDVIMMSQRGLSDSVIISHIQANGVRQELRVPDVIALHENGVSQHVIAAMQRPATVTAAPAAPVRVYQSAPPIVVEKYVTPRYYYPPRRPYYHGPRHHHHRGSGIHFSLHR